MGEGCESSILAGVGVALKLVQVLGARRGYPHLWRSYTDLATLGTVADLMPMRGENRALVAEGLKRINESPRPCIAALLGICGPSAVPVTATNITYSMLLRLNAAGRMGDAQLALDLLMSDSYPDACALAQRLDEVNTARRTIEAELSEQAKAQAAEAVPWPAGAGGGWRGLARRGEGHRGQPLGESLRRARHSVYRGGGRGARLGPQRGLGEPVRRRRVLFRLAHPFRRPRGGSGH